MNMKRIFGIAVMGFTVAYATPAQMNPGLWEVTTTVEMSGMQGMQGMPAGGQTYKNTMCMRASDMEMGKKGIDKDMPKTCKITNMKSSGSNLSYNMSCSGEQPMKGKVTINFKPNSYTGTMIMDVGGENAMKMTTKYSGKRIGACK